MIRHKEQKTLEPSLRERIIAEIPATAMFGMLGVVAGTALGFAASYEAAWTAGNWLFRNVGVEYSVQEVRTSEPQIQYQIWRDGKSVDVLSSPELQVYCPAALESATH